MTRKVEMVGKRYGRIIILSDTEPRRTSTKTQRQVICKCLCGNPNEFVRIAQDIRRGDIVSCGCLSKESLVDKAEPKGLYGSWYGLQIRAERRSLSGDLCRVFEGWLCFETFKEWSLRNGWKEGMELCRNKDSGDYSPENVRWDTKTSNRQEAHGKGWLVTSPTGTEYPVLSLGSFCEEHGLGSASKLYKSAKTGKPTKHGWSAKLLGKEVF